MTTTSKVGQGLLAVVSVFLIIGGCGISRHVQERAGSDRSLAFGAIVGDKFNNVSFVELSPLGKKPWSGSGRYGGDGLFQVENLVPGTYVLQEFMYVRSDGAVFRSVLEASESNPTRFKITKPGIYYIGSFKKEWYRPPGHGLKADRFRLVPVSSPSESELLTRLLPYTKGTQWERMVAQRLNQVKGGK